MCHKTECKCTCTEKKACIVTNHFRATPVDTVLIELLQAFASEIEANKARLDTVKESGGKLLQEKPEMKEEIVPKIQDLEEEFTELQTETSEKGERIFDNNRVNLYEQSVDALDGHIKEVAGEIENEDVDDVKNFTGVQVCTSSVSKK